MTTNQDIIYEKILDAVIQCRIRGLLLDSEKAVFMGDLLDLLEKEIEPKKATQHQIEWNEETNI